MRTQGERALSGEELEILFRNAGVKMTNQRVAVYREVAECRSHPTVDEIYDRVREGLPAISLNTVYRTLATLIEKGLLRRPEKSNSATFYDGNMKDHHHFVCSRCGKVRDIYIDNVNDLRLTEVDEKIEEITIQLRGVCNACKADSPGDRSL